MFQQLQAYSSGIIVLGVGMMKQGVQRGDNTWLIGGLLTLVLGLTGLIYRRWHNLGWVMAALGGLLILIGTAESHTFWGYTVDAPDMLFVVGGAALTMAGMAFLGMSFTATSRGQTESPSFQNQRTLLRSG
ncbi:MAG: hypothetical protein KF893_01890 [Caldilineaceae bacterium]|nr:hypothetical protein [Caldilineaceae bacterium]